MNATKPACLSVGYRYVSYVSSSLGLLLNLVVIVLVIFRTTKELKVYSRVLLSNCLVDIVFISVSFVVDLHISFRDGVAFYVVNGFFTGQSLQFKFSMTCVYLFALYMSIFAVTPPFVYRYLAVCKNYVLTKTQFLSLMFVELLLAVSVGAYVWVACWPIAQQTAAQIFIDDLPCADPGQVPYFRVSDASSLRVASLLLYAGSLAVLNYVITVACSYKIMNTLSSLADAGRRQSSLNKQLNMVLVLQAASPLIVAVVPLVACIAMLLLSYSDAGVLVESITSVESLVPVLNPLYTICFVKAYRRTIMGCFKRSVVPGGSTGNSGNHATGR